MTNPTTTTDLVAVNGETAAALYLSPEAAIQEAEAAATAFNGVIQKRKAQLVTTIQGRDHIKIEGWLTLGTLAAALFRGPITPYVVWVRAIADADGVLKGYEARCEARCGDRVLTSAEAACLFAERNWQGKDDFAVRSMAQTRACSKAMAFALRWVMVLAGYEGTPAEDVTGIDNAPPARRPPVRPPQTAPKVKSPMACEHLSILDVQRFEAMAEEQGKETSVCVCCHGAIAPSGSERCKLCEKHTAEAMQE